MFDQLSLLEDRFEELNRRLSQPDIASNPAQMRVLRQEHSELDKIVSVYRNLKHLKAEHASSLEMLMQESDSDLQALCKEELRMLESQIPLIEEQLKISLLPKDPNDSKSVILEIRSGTGGDEASLFVGDLFKMYSRFAERRGYKIDMMSVSPGAQGGFKEIIMGIEGPDAFSNFKYESGVHRVQRVPATETQGRIHTSAITVAVLPEVDEIEVNIQDKDLRIDVYRSGGPGGQSVNTTDSAVRVTHIPSGLVVACQDEKSQHKNKAKALKILRSRLFDKMLAEQDAKIAADRRSMVKTGDRSEKIRTYNFPQDRLTDHRIGLTVHNLPKLLQGFIDDVVVALRAYYQAELLARAGKDPSLTRG